MREVTPEFSLPVAIENQKSKMLAVEFPRSEDIAPFRQAITDLNSLQHVQANMADGSVVLLWTLMPNVAPKMVRKAIEDRLAMSGYVYPQTTPAGQVYNSYLSGIRIRAVDDIPHDADVSVVSPNCPEYITPTSFTPLTLRQEKAIKNTLMQARESVLMDSSQLSREWVNKAKTDGAKKAYQAYLKTGFLAEEFPIVLHDGKEVTVRDIFENPTSFDGERCYDPVEGDAYGVCAKIFVRSDGSIQIISQTYDQVVYRLTSDIWTTELTVSKTGEVVQSSVTNAEIIVRNVSQKRGDVVRFDEFRNTPTVNGKPVTEIDLLLMRKEAESYVKSIGKDIVDDGYTLHALADRHHPVRDYLNGLKWDGVKRIDSWLVDYVGVTDSPVTRQIGRKFIISMVARPLRPGCKVDTVLILSSAQGMRKSTFAEVMCGNDDYFSDTMPSIHNDSDEARKHLAGKWVIELAEMSATKKADIDTLKGFLSAKKDNYRVAYARKDMAVPRQCVFIATTNNDTPLTDSTGNRRFWPVHVERQADIEKLKRDRDQLFAEAVVAFESGEPWWFDQGTAEAEMFDQQTRLFTEADPFADPLIAKIEDRKERITTETLRELLEIPVSQWNKLNKSRAIKAMRSIDGWEEVKVKGYSTWKRKAGIVEAVSFDPNENTKSNASNVIQMSEYVATKPEASKFEKAATDILDDDEFLKQFGDWEGVKA